MEIRPNVDSAWAALRPALETMCKSNLPFADVEQMLLRAYVDIAIKQNRGNISAAGRMIHLHRNTIYRYVDRKWTRTPSERKPTGSSTPA